MKVSSVKRLIWLIIPIEYGICHPQKFKPPFFGPFGSDEISDCSPPMIHQPTGIFPSLLAPARLDSQIHLKFSQLVGFLFETLEDPKRVTKHLREVGGTHT